LIKHVPYLADPELVVLQTDAIRALRLAQEQRFLLFLHSNQSGVGRGFFTESDVDRVNHRMLDLLGAGRGLFERICIAPEKPDEPSLYRKPSSRLVREIQSDYGFPLEKIIYIGDRVVDLETAYQAGSRAVGVATGLVDLRKEISSFPHLLHYPLETSLLDAVALAVR
jgi:D-glycero-D-manno-heptose 1,7-bisphosphate phosphatase